jgi:hypothetical protein
MLSREPCDGPPAPKVGGFNDERRALPVPSRVSDPLPNSR